MFDIFVTTVSGVRVPLSVDPQTTGSDLKDLVRQRADVPKLFRLGFKADYLTEKSTLSSAGVPAAAEIWMSKREPTKSPQSGYTQALGRVARGKQPNGSTLHAIVAVGTELKRTMNTRADAIDTKLDENTKELSKITHALNGGETTADDGLTYTEQKTRIKMAKTVLEARRKDIIQKEQKEQEVKQEAKEVKQKAKQIAKEQRTIVGSQALHDAAVVAESAVHDTSSLEDLEVQKKALNKIINAKKKQQRSELGETPAPKKKPRLDKKASADQNQEGSTTTSNTTAVEPIVTPEEDKEQIQEESTPTSTTAAAEPTVTTEEDKEREQHQNREEPTPATDLVVVELADIEQVFEEHVTAELATTVVRESTVDTVGDTTASGDAISSPLARELEDDESEVLPSKLSHFARLLGVSSISVHDSNDVMRMEEQALNQSRKEAQARRVASNPGPKPNSW